MAVSASLGLCLCGCFRPFSFFCLQFCWLRWRCRIFTRFWFWSICLPNSPLLFLLLLDSGWDGVFCLLVCFTYYLSLVCLRHLSTYCYLVSLLRMTMMYVSMLVHSVWGLLWCNIVYIPVLQIYWSTQPQHFEIRGITVEGKGVKPSWPESNWGSCRMFL